MFEKLLEDAYHDLQQDDEDVVHFFVEYATEDDLDILKEAFCLDESEVEELREAFVKRVNSKGEIRKTLSRKIRARRAAMTTGISKSQLKLRARKSVRAKRRDPMGQRVALRKRRKAMRRRKQFGIK